jgi:hypothetical protein
VLEPHTHNPLKTSRNAVWSEEQADWGQSDDWAHDAAPVDDGGGLVSAVDVGGLASVVVIGGSASVVDSGVDPSLVVSSTSVMPNALYMDVR